MKRCQGKKGGMVIHIVKYRWVCYEKIGMAAMDKKERETLGAYLRREREARDIKLTALSKATKISLPLLVALESDDRNAFPDKKAVPDYLKNYCRYLLIDEQDALKRFELQPAKHCLPEAIETCLPEVIDNLMPLPVVAPLCTLPPTVISSAKETGFFRRHRLVFISVGTLVLMFVIFSGLLFYFHPLRDRADNKEGIKVEVPQVEVPQAAVKSHAPAVGKEKVIGNRDSEMKAPAGSGKVAAIKKIAYEKGTEGQDKVMVAIDRMTTPEISNMGGDNPRIIMDFFHAKYGNGLPLHLDAKGLYVQRIRVGKYLEPSIKTRIVLDLVPGQKYFADQVFDEKENIYYITVGPPK
ncbi:MAG: helix-turn-helix domain-containing protein [Syntrophales bacterium]|nr:helix-turn-helix domain-containing protein [Syntrophales bacterium]MCK9390867.1 helix-turn-helix domain-containing protein [Syntrophales bacterium]